LVAIERELVERHTDSGLAFPEPLVGDPDDDDGSSRRYRVLHAGNLVSAVHDAS
jgi:hypothetical protein